MKKIAANLAQSTRFARSLRRKTRPFPPALGNGGRWRSDAALCANDIAKFTKAVTVRTAFKGLRAAIILLCLAVGITPAATAHNVGSSYIRIDGQQLRVDLALRDLQFAVGLDNNDDGVITWGELDGRSAVLQYYVEQHLIIGDANERCAMAFAPLQIDSHQDGPYAVLTAQLRCSSRALQRLHSDLLFALDTSHRSLLSIARGGRVTTSLLTSEHRDWNSDAGDATRKQTVLRFVRQGGWHIWTGFDHLAFLLLLLLPVVALEPHSAPAVNTPRRVLSRIVRIVTAFTAAHSITLTLAALGQINLPSRPVEMLIAVSVIVAGLGNLNNRLRHLGVITAFGFGLIHGFGFASALAGLQLERGARVLPLLGFNLGVELGQLAVVACVLPLLFYARRSPFYLRRLLPLSSLAIAAVGTIWLIQRGFNM